MLNKYCRGPEPGENARKFVKRQMQARKRGIAVLVDLKRAQEKSTCFVWTSSSSSKRWRELRQKVTRGGRAMLDQSICGAALCNLLHPGRVVLGDLDGDRERKTERGSEKRVSKRRHRIVR